MCRIRYPRTDDPSNFGLGLRETDNQFYSYLERRTRIVVLVQDLKLVASWLNRTEQYTELLRMRPAQTVSWPHRRAVSSSATTGLHIVDFLRPYMPLRRRLSR